MTVFVFSNSMVKDDLYNQTYREIKVIERDGEYQIDLDQVPYYVGEDDFLIFPRADYRKRLAYSSYGISWVFIDEDGNRVPEQKYLTSF